MNRHKTLIRLLTVSLMGALAALYTLKIRPWLLDWGATADERTRTSPGDDLVPNPTHITTRAITINASPDEIWSWLVQMGQDRAGFYTHNWVEKLLLSGIRDFREIHPEWQELNVGDIVRTNRAMRPGQAPLGWPVVSVDPLHSLVLRSRSTPVGTYAFVLGPLDDRRTRLIARDRAIWTWRQTLFRLLIFEPLHAYMQTGVLRGIKCRVERVREVVMARAGGTRGQERARALPSQVNSLIVTDGRPRHTRSPWEEWHTSTSRRRS
jgi:hypothetical protein